MRIIARSTLDTFAKEHPETAPSIAHWFNTAKIAKWKSPSDVKAAFPKSKIINGERVRFEIAGGNYRMIVAFDFYRMIAFIKFIGSHAEYDDVDAEKVSKF